MTRDQDKTKAELIAEITALRASTGKRCSDHFKQMVDDLPQIVFEMSPDGRFTYVNNHALDAFGYTLNDLKNGIAFTDILHPDSQKLVRKNIARVLGGGKSFREEMLGRRKDGTSFPLKVYSKTIVKNGNVVGLRGIVVNMTDIKNAQAALLESETHYRTLFDNTGTAMVIYGEDTIISSCNSQFATLSGHTGQEIEGNMRWTDFVAPEDLGLLLDTHKKVQEQGQPLPDALEFSFLTREGKRRRVHAAIKRIPGSTDRICSITDITNQKRIEEALRKSEERYQLVVRGANDGIWDWDLATDSVYFSPRYKELLGYEDDEFPNVADSWKNAIHPDDLDKVMTANLECIQGTADHFRVEYRLRHKDGAYRWILGRGASARDDRGQVYRLAGTHTDVTERRIAESRFRDIFENASDGIYQCTPNGRMITANNAMARCFGYDSPEDFTKSMTDIETQLWVDPNDRRIFLRNLELTGQLQNYEEHLYRKDGSRIWISESVRAVRDDNGEVAYYEGFVQDITTRKLHEATTHALYAISRAIATTRDLQELYETIHDVLDRVIDATNFFIAMYDKKGDYVVFSYFADEVDEYYDITNVSDPNTKGLTVHVLRTGKTLFLTRANPIDPEIEQNIGVIGTPAQVWVGVPLIIQGETKGVMAVQHYTNPLHYSAQDVTFLETVSEQVALAIERKSNEEALTRLNEELEAMVDRRTAELKFKASELETANKRLTELDAIKSSLVSSVSHELRTPLTSIRGFAKLTGRDFIKHFDHLADTDQRRKKSDRIRQNLEIIETEGERLTRLINDFLDINRIESGKATWNDRFLNPCEVIRQAANAVAGGLTAKPDVKLTIDLPEFIAPIHADPDKMQQILINLLNNACKFTDTGTITVSATSSDTTLTVSVEDTGSGIAEDELPHVFEKFHKTKGDTITVENKGTGLGLTICKEIVEHYGGTIQVDSTQGKGSRFTFFIPCVAGSETACS